MLTGLGIIFGVAAVIAMLAIGNGAQQEILEQIRLVGVNNIVITPIVEQVEEEISEESFSLREPQFSPGLTLLDSRSMVEIIPGIERVSPEIIMETFVIKKGIRRSAKLVGVDSTYFDMTSFSLLLAETSTKNNWNAVIRFASLEGVLKPGFLVKRTLSEKD